MADFGINNSWLKSVFACILLSGSTAFTLAAQDSDTLRYKVYFPMGSAEFVPSLDDNRAVLRSVIEEAGLIDADSLIKANALKVRGAASPEGPVKPNVRLSHLRAEEVIKMLPDFGITPEVEIVPLSWGSVIDLAEADPDLPYHDETLTALYFLDRQGIEKAVRNNILKSVAGGKAYRYLAKHIFPKLRYAEIILTVHKDAVTTAPCEDDDVKNTADTFVPEVVEEVTEVTEETTSSVRHHRPFLMDIRTNMLYDAAALPNIGVEFWLGGAFSAGLNWQYAWWSKSARHRFWRAYGGDINARWWFGRVSKEKPLSGHHLGVYGQMLTYDLEWGKTGYMGGKPHGTLWQRMNWGAGVEYGYSLPVSRYFNIDFTAGFGYFGGKYYEYRPIDNHDVWMRTRKLNWWGPTKAEISLVWMLGNARIRNANNANNINTDKNNE